MMVTTVMVAVVPAQAQENGLPAAPTPAVLEAPRLAAVCAACHGKAGVPISQQTPVIWGQNEGYLYLQLRDMKKGARKVPAMAAVVALMEKPDMQALAAYFAAQPWPNLAQPSAADEDARRAQAQNSAVGCTGCHLDGYHAAGSVPRLAGQERSYLIKTMTDFRSGTRANNPGMTDLMNATDADAFTAIAAYLAGL